MKFVATDCEIEIRPGTINDVPLLLSFIRSMANFEKLEVHATEEDLKESLFGEHPAAYTLLAFVEGTPAAYAVYFYSFSTMRGKRCLWLDDLFVNPEFRGKSIAKVLMAYLAEHAIRSKCGRFEWMVLEWNKTAMDFFKGLGATIQEEWRIFHLDGGKLEDVAKQLVRADKN